MEWSEADTDVFTVDYTSDDEEQQKRIRAELDKRRGSNWRGVRQLTIIPGTRRHPGPTTDTLRCYVVWDQRM